eukprot:5571247-Pleurochrysis_carterae.AAC.1
MPFSPSTIISSNCLGELQPGPTPRRGRKMLFIVANVWSCDKCVQVETPKDCIASCSPTMSKRKVSERTRTRADRAGHTSTRDAWKRNERSIGCAIKVHAQRAASERFGTSAERTVRI